MDISAYLLSKAGLDLRAKWDGLAGDLERADDEKISYVWAAIIDFLTPLSRQDFQDLFANEPAWSLSDFKENYLVGLIERVAQNLNIPAPNWALDVNPLADPYFPEEHPKLRVYLMLHGDPIFRRRNIFIDSSIGGRV